MEYEHTFTNTPDGTLAGIWRSTDHIAFPICSWIYDLPELLLQVTRGRVVRKYHCPLGIGMDTDADRRRTLPLKALGYARTIKQPH